MYWGWFWIWTWFPFAGYWAYLLVLYGYDFLAYARYPNNVGNPSEAWVYVNSLWQDQWMQDQNWKNIVNALGAIGGIFLSSVATALTAGSAAVAANTIISVAVAVVEATAGRAVDNVFLATWNTLLSVYAYNNEHDPTWGVETMQRFHYVVTPQPDKGDAMSFMTFHFAYYNGATIQVVPLPGLVIPLYAASANTCWLATLEWTNVYPLNSWVWIGPLEA